MFHNSNVFGSCIIQILYIYSTNIGTAYFKHGIYSPFFPLQNAVCSIIVTYLVPVLFTFYIQGVLKLNKIIPAPKVNVEVVRFSVLAQLNGRTHELRDVIAIVLKRSYRTVSSR